MFNTMKIRHKVWAGFAVLLAIIAAISVQTLNSLDSVENSVVEMVQIRQPTALLSRNSPPAFTRPPVHWASSCQPRRRAIVKAF